MEVLGGPNPISLGATTVYAGEPAPPIESIDPRPKEKPKSWWERKLRRLDELVEVEVGGELDLGVLPTKGTVDVGAELDVDGLGIGGNVHGEGEGALLRVGGAGRVRVTIDGEPYDVVDMQFDQDIGAWKGWFDVIFDPVQRRPHVDGEFDFEVFGDDEEE
jgi:hypothetical protein